MLPAAGADVLRGPLQVHGRRRGRRVGVRLRRVLSSLAPTPPVNPPRARNNRPLGDGVGVRRIMMPPLPARPAVAAQTRSPPLEASPGGA